MSVKSFIWRGNTWHQLFYIRSVIRWHHCVISDRTFPRVKDSWQMLQFPHGSTCDWLRSIATKGGDDENTKGKISRSKKEEATSWNHSGHDTVQFNMDEQKNDGTCIFSKASFPFQREDDLTTCPALKLRDKDCSWRVSCRPAVAGGGVVSWALSVYFPWYFIYHCRSPHTIKVTEKEK